MDKGYHISRFSENLTKSNKSVQNQKFHQKVIGSPLKKTLTLKECAQGRSINEALLSKKSGPWTANPIHLTSLHELGHHSVSSRGEL